MHRSINETTARGAPAAAHRRKRLQRAHRYFALLLVLALACSFVSGCRSPQKGPQHGASPQAPPNASPNAPVVAVAAAALEPPPREDALQRAHELFGAGDVTQALVLYRAALDDPRWPWASPLEQHTVTLRAAVLLLQPGRGAADWQLAKRYLEQISDAAGGTRSSDSSPPSEREGSAFDRTPGEEVQARRREQELTAALVLRLQEDLERQYRRLEQLKQIDLDASPPPAPAAETNEPQPPPR